MRTAATIAQWINILAGVAQIILGVYFWSGRALSLLTLHMVVGLLFVIALWTLAGLARRTGVAWRWVVLSIVWGVIVAAFGGVQAGLLPGPLHWIVRVLHLLIGIAGMVMAGMLGRAIRRRSSRASFH
jgi:hypothetical protein